MRTQEELGNYVLRRNEYVVVTFSNGTEIAIVRTACAYSEHTYILQQWDDGSQLPLSERPLRFRNGYYSWAADARRNIYTLLEDYDDRNRRFNLCDIEEISQVMKIDESLPDEVIMEFIHPNYKRDHTYTGMGNYHDSVDWNDPIKTDKEYRIGVELEIEAKSSTLKNFINETKSNWFYQQRDGSLGSNGIEIITVPLQRKDAMARSTWRELVEYLSDKAEAWKKTSCGLHVHFGREVLGDTAEQQSETIGKMLYLYHHFLNRTPINEKIYGRSRTYNEQVGTSETADAAKKLGSDVFKVKEIKDRVKDALTTASSTGRYFDINLRNANTIEFRKGKASINVDRIIAIIRWSELIVLYSKKASWTKISYDDFISYVSKNITETEPLAKYFITNTNEQ